MPQLDGSLRVLRSKGYKVTAPRKQVLEALKETSKPLSAYEVQKWLQGKGKSLNPVTIYRILNLLCSLNLAHRIPSSGGFVVCTLNEGEGCHRFVVCRYWAAFRNLPVRHCVRRRLKLPGRVWGFRQNIISRKSPGCAQDVRGGKDEDEVYPQTWFNNYSWLTSNPRGLSGTPSENKA